MKNKFYNRFLALLLAFVLAVSSVGISPASAKPQTAPDPDCKFSPVSITVEIGKVITFHVSNPDPLTSYMWEWGNGTEVKTGEVATNYWSALGDVPMSLTSSNRAHGTNRCNSWVHVVPATQEYDNGLGGGFNFPTETPPAPIVTPDPSITVGNISANEIEAGRNDNGSFDNIITGDNNKVIIKIEQVSSTTPSPTVTITTTPTPSATPIATVVVPNTTCNGYCAYNGSTINVNPTPSTTVSKTTATNGFWLFVQMAISPFVILNDYIIQNK